MNHLKKSRHFHVISANSTIVRNINRSVIFNFVRERQPISRAAIARLARLNKSTVSSIVTSLIKEDLIVEDHGRRKSDSERSVGRNPISLRLKKGRNLVGAICLDPSITRSAVVDIDGSIIHIEENKTDLHPTEESVAYCAETLKAIRARHHFPHLRGIGVSVAGIVDSSQEKVVFSPGLGWVDLHVGEIVRKRFPDASIVAVENDARASALAELWFGRYENLTNFVFLSVGRGIGAGIVIDKRILSGESNLAGEFGHTPLIEDGELCVCGNRGCWEAYASDSATIRRYVLAKGGNGNGACETTIEEIIVGANGTDPVARQELKRTGQYLGIGIANIIKAVDPDAVIIGGPIHAAWDLIAPEITKEVRRRTFFGKSSTTRILPTSLSEHPSLLGAAAMAQRKLVGDVRVTL